MQEEAEEPGPVVVRNFASLEVELPQSATLSGRGQKKTFLLSNRSVPVKVTWRSIPRVTEGAFVNTLRRVFGHVYVFCTDPAGVTDRRDTFVVAASNVALDIAGWEPNHAGGFDGSVLTGGNVSVLVAKAGGRILTDDNAPVENLLAPVVRERTRGHGE